MILFDLSSMLYSLSTALDIVEKELLGATSNHSKRVAYISLKMAKALGYDGFRLMSIAGCAVLHDCALTEYIHDELDSKINPSAEIDLRPHCVAGERNVSGLPFDKFSRDAVLYHHEEADGRGPFKKVAENTPIAAQIIHLADQLDVSFALADMTEEKLGYIDKYIDDNTGTLFAPSVAKLFKKSVSHDNLCHMDSEIIDDLLFEEYPHQIKKYDDSVLIYISKMFANIIDYKSPFTNSHSIGIAKKAEKMGEYYHLGDDMKTKLFFAGAVHDIGKLVIDNNILDKPGSLNSEEFARIQDHAYASYEILHNIRGLEDVTEWSYCHHEKLDGSGYPFGYKADKLNHNDRLLACIDIYQALVEPRPYRDSLSHEEAIDIMQCMAENGKIDAQITEDINKCFDEKMIRAS